MKIAEIIKSGIPKVGTAYMSDNIRYDSYAPIRQKYQIIGYDDYFGEVRVHVVTDNFKTLKIEKYTISNFLSMKLEKSTPLLKETSIKKTKWIEENKFYLNPYGILYTHSDRRSLLVNGIGFTVVEQGLSTLKGKNIEYEITDMEEVKKILEKQKKYYDEMLSFYFYDDTHFNELIKMSLNDLLNGPYVHYASSFLISRVLTHKLLDIVIEKMSNNV